MRKYEVMYILKPDLDEAKIKEINQVLAKAIVSLKSKVVEKKEIGIQPLAYPIQKYEKGYYYWMIINAGREALHELNRLIGINENIIRSLVVKEEE